LLGGMTTLALLVALSLKTGEATPPRQTTSALRLPAAIALLAVIAQIALGGWVSSNYAVLACPDFPLCQGQWGPDMDFAAAFSVQRNLGYTAQGSLISSEALTAIHWTHRLGALVVLLAVSALAFTLLRSGERNGQRWGGLLLALLTLQIGLGIANVLLTLPLALAVAHNLGAASLLSAVLAINLRCPAIQSTRPEVAISTQCTVQTMHGSNERTTC
jgi:cytochrome c oxidase assembly protein subunit 15